MGNVNKVILIGYLGADPEVKSLDGGRALTTFRIATSERWKDKVTGESRERTEWHRIVAWGKTGELAGQYLGKGRHVYVEGRLQTRAWKDAAGAERHTTEVVADSVTFLDRRPAAESEDPQAEAAAA